jgi:hypothetical protein
MWSEGEGEGEGGSLGFSLFVQSHYGATLVAGNRFP